MIDFNQQWADFVIANHEMSVGDIARALGVCHSTASRYKRQFVGYTPKPRKSTKRSRKLVSRSFSGCIPLPNCLKHLETNNN